MRWVTAGCMAKRFGGCLHDIESTNIAKKLKEILKGSVGFDPNYNIDPLI